MTGTGNTMNMDQPQDHPDGPDLLRYRRDMGVDGFRFNLAATLGRFSTGFSPMHLPSSRWATDDILTHTKLIAEPWMGSRRLVTGNSGALLRVNDHYCGALHFGPWTCAPVPGPHRSGLNDLATRPSGSQDARSTASVWL